MTTRTLPFVFLSLMCSMHLNGMETEHAFTKAQVHFVQNVSKGNVEVVFEVVGEEDGLVDLTILSPRSKAVVDFIADEKTTLGVRTFRFATPEPTDIKTVKSSYIEGDYKFTGTTPSGKELKGKAFLSHLMPEPSSFTNPAPKSGHVDLKGLTLKWAAVSHISAYLITVEQEGSDALLSVRLPGNQTSFHVPEGFLSTGKTYKLSLSTVLKNGNVTTIETTFTTASNTRR